MQVAIHILYPFVICYLLFANKLSPPGTQASFWGPSGLRSFTTFLTWLSWRPDAATAVYVSLYTSINRQEIWSSKVFINTFQRLLHTALHIKQKSCCTSCCTRQKQTTLKSDWLNATSHRIAEHCHSDDATAPLPVSLLLDFAWVNACFRHNDSSSSTWSESDSGSRSNSYPTSSVELMHISIHYSVKKSATVWFLNSKQTDIYKEYLLNMKWDTLRSTHVSPVFVLKSGQQCSTNELLLITMFWINVEKWSHKLSYCKHLKLAMLTVKPAGT